MTLVDTHAHLQDRRLADDLDAVLTRARAAGVTRVLAIGTTAADSAEVVAIANLYEHVFAAVGIQPNHVAEAAEGDFACVAALADDPRVKAIGETGLDRYWDRAPLGLQRDYFGRHLTLARTLNLPVVIHCRECEQDIVDQLESFGPPIAGVLHSFTGTVDQAAKFLQLGLHISIAGMVTFPSKNSDALREAARSIPADRLLVETDSPYLSPQPFRGKTNEPARVALTAAYLAELRGEPLGRLAEATTANALRLFDLT